MDSTRADLASVATALEELRSRVVAAADTERDRRHDDTAAALYDVERSLLAALRRIDSVVRGER